MHRSLSGIGIGLFFLSSVASASNYPSNYADQKVRAVHKGPMLYARVFSGMGASEVLGYKLSGHLTKNSPRHIDAILIFSCINGRGALVQTQTTVRLGREYHGKGYMSDGSGFASTASYAMHCRNALQLQIAFSAGRDNWDSNFGANYSIGEEDFYGNNPNVRYFDTRQAGGSSINLAAWEFIVSEMDRR